MSNLMKMNHFEKQVHAIEPVFNSDSRLLILGSFPSVQSRKTGFFYSHPKNRFWKVLAAIINSKVPITIEEKKAFLLERHIALWDVIASCVIMGSRDSSIRKIVPNEITRILQVAPIRCIGCNGSISYQLYKKYIYPLTKREAVKLPSSSPANTAWNLEKLKNEWKVCWSFIENVV